MLKKFFSNPLTIWLVRFIQATKLEIAHRRQGLHIGFMSYAEGCTFGRHNVLHHHVSLVDVRLGDATYISNGTTIIHTTIGKYCSIGPEVRCGLGIHPTDFVSTHPAFYSTKMQAGFTLADRDYLEENKPVTIGHDVWIGARAMIADGVTIGHGAIIAAGAVVTKDVPPYAIVGGVPVKLIRYRFDPQTIEQLLAAEWWHWPEARLAASFREFHDTREWLETVSRS